MQLPNTQFQPWPLKLHANTVDYPAGVQWSDSNFRAFPMSKNSKDLHAGNANRKHIEVPRSANQRLSPHVTTLQATSARQAKSRKPYLCDGSVPRFFLDVGPKQHMGLGYFPREPWKRRSLAASCEVNHMTQSSSGVRQHFWHFSDSKWIKCGNLVNYHAQLDATSAAVIIFPSCPSKERSQNWSKTTTNSMSFLS
jgi:hypothetical protein